MSDLKKSKFTFVPSSANCLDAIYLFKEVFDAPMSQDFWFWKYPENSESFSVSVYCNDEITGHNGGILRDFNFQGVLYKALQSCDVAIKKEFRSFHKDGVFDRMTKQFISNAFENGVDFIYGFPHGRHLKLGVRVGSYLSAGSVLQWISKGYMSSPVEGIREVFLREFSSEDYACYLSSFYSSLNNSNYAFLLRDFDYIKFRYISNPTFSYRYFVHEYALVVVKNNGNMMVVMDYIGDIDYFKTVMTVLHSQASHEGFSGLNFWTSEGIRNHLLHSDLFRIKDDSAGLAFRWRTSSSVVPNMWITCGDTDFM
tara:strand:+ start:1655 stop:2590 length:936 start_codon:yes stop_codon:yes gene_type:complete